MKCPILWLLEQMQLQMVREMEAFIDWAMPELRILNTLDSWTTR